MLPISTLTKKQNQIVCSALSLLSPSKVNLPICGRIHSADEETGDEKTEELIELLKKETRPHR